MYLHDVLVATSPVITLTRSGTFLASGYGGLVDSVVVNTTFVGYPPYYVLDDIKFQAVPEPATLGLLGTGVAAIAARVARRRRSSRV
jgi:hypothetical protein